MVNAVNLSRRQLGRLLWWANAALCAGILLVLALSFMPLEAQEALAGGPQKQPTTQKAQAAAKSLDHYAVLWQRDLQRPLYDPAPTAAAGPAKPKLQIRLVGTAVEPEYCRGFFDVPGKGTVVAAVGDKVGEGAIVKSIEDQSAVVEYLGEDVSLKVQKEK